MWFFDSIVDQAQTATSMTTKKAPMEITADSLIILDDAPSNTHLESALGLTGPTVPTEVIAPVPPVDFLSLGDATIVEDTSSSVIMLDMPADDTQVSSGFGLFMDSTEESNASSEVVDWVVSSEASSEEVAPISMVSELSESVTENMIVENTDSSFSLVSDAEIVSPVSVVEMTSDITPESILSQAIASLKMISDTTDAKRQSALDLETSLLAQISDEIEAHKAKIAHLEASAAEAKATAEQIELDGRKTKDRIILLEKELEAV